MDSLTYHGGLMLKRTLEASGRPPTVNDLLVAVFLMAQEQGKSLEELVQVLIEVSVYETTANKLDQDARIRQLMGY